MVFLLTSSGPVEARSRVLGSVRRSDQAPLAPRPAQGETSGGIGDSDSGWGQACLDAIEETPAAGLVIAVRESGELNARPFPFGDDAPEVALVLQSSSDPLGGYQTQRDLSIKVDKGPASVKRAGHGCGRPHGSRWFSMSVARPSSASAVPAGWRGWSRRGGTVPMAGQLCRRCGPGG